MFGLVRNTSTSRRWRTALRAGVLAASLAVVAGMPLAAQAHEWEHGWRGHEWRENREWRAHEWHEHHPYWGYRHYYAPSYGYYGYAPSYGYYGYAPSYGYYSPGYYGPSAALNFNFR